MLNYMEILKYLHFNQEMQVFIIILNMKQIMKQFLTTTKFNNYSIDIRTYGGYIIGHGSKILN